MMIAQRGGSVQSGNVLAAHRTCPSAPGLSPGSIKAGHDVGGQPFRLLSVLGASCGRLTFVELRQVEAARGAGCAQSLSVCRYLA